MAIAFVVVGGGGGGGGGGWVFGLFSWFWCFGFFPAAQLVVS